MPKIHFLQNDMRKYGAYTANINPLSPSKKNLCEIFKVLTIWDNINLFIRPRHHLFEASKENKAQIENTLRQILGVECEVYNKGLYSFEGKLKFDYSPENPAGSRISGEDIENPFEQRAVEVVPLDAVVGDDEITFIKMDIEGSELEALKGAKKTIQRCRPKMAISVYHKPEDIVTIPLYIKELVPDYKFYIRKYRSGTWETILYCV